MGERSSKTGFVCGRLVNSPEEVPLAQGSIFSSIHEVQLLPGGGEKLKIFLLWSLSPEKT